MIELFKKINWISCEPLDWHLIEGQRLKYFTSKYPKVECWIRMNDFPEEPLWTLFYKGETKDFNDTPKLWRIYYPEK